MKKGNPLERYFYDNKGRLIHKWLHYFDIYDRHFAPYRGKQITVVEFGVSHGGSPPVRVAGVARGARHGSLVSTSTRSAPSSSSRRSRS